MGIGCCRRGAMAADRARIQLVMAVRLAGGCELAVVDGCRELMQSRFQAQGGGGGLRVRRGDGVEFAYRPASFVQDESRRAGKRLAEIGPTAL